MISCSSLVRFCRSSKKSLYFQDIKACYLSPRRGCIPFSMLQTISVDFILSFQVKVQQSVHLLEIVKMDVANVLAAYEELLELLRSLSLVASPVERHIRELEVHGAVLAAELAVLASAALKNALDRRFILELHD